MAGPDDCVAIGAVRKGIRNLSEPGMEASELPRSGRLLHVFVARPGTG
jgi:hypothetical protein